jgi:hypothetical protein
MFQVPATPPAGEVPLDIDLSVFDALEAPDLFNEPLGIRPDDPVPGDAPIALSGRDLERFKYRLDLSLSKAKGKMTKVHADARMDRQVYKTLERDQEYPGQPNVTTPISANKSDGLLAQLIDAMEQRPLASFVPEGIGRPAERAAQVAPLCAAYLEREINRGGSRERIVRELSKEAVKVGTGIGKLGAVQHPSGEWFMQVTGVIPLERVFFDRLSVPNLKHCFTAYEERIAYYQLEEMADAGLIDRTALERIRMSHSSEFIRSEEEKEAEFMEGSHAFEEENAVHKIYNCYLRFRPSDGGGKSEIYEAVWSDTWKELLAVRLNPVREAFDHPPMYLVRVGKEAGHLLGRGIMRRLAPIQQMADNAINSHLAINDLAAAPPFLYRQQSPFGRLMASQRRIVPGIGIPTLNAPDQGDVKIIDAFRNPGLSLQDISVAQDMADKATYTEEAIGTSAARKTLGQFRVEVQRGTMRVRLDIGDIAYDHAVGLTMLWAMIVAYKVKPHGIVEVEEGGRFLATRDIFTEEIQEVMDGIILPMFEAGEIGLQDLMDLEEEFNQRLTDDMIPSARRSDLTVHLTGTKVIADKAAELEMLGELTPIILQGISLMREDSYWNYHVRSIIEAMGFKDVEKRVPPDPGRILQDDGLRQQLGQPLAETIMHSSSMV